MKRNIQIIIEYKGTNYFGWQKQNGRQTIQGKIEDALKRLTGEDISIEGSGRTDRGVHALGQVASFVMENSMPTKNLVVGLNDLLPPDIRVLKAKQVSEDFHARFCAKRKTYKYCVLVKGIRPAVESDTWGYYPFSVDLEKMERVAQLLKGKHNFKAFCNADTNVTNFEREIFELKITQRGNRFIFRLTGNGFLYNMVRIIVGTLLDVGRGKLTEEDLSKALETGERKYAGITMEACGLYLESVKYV